MNTQIRHVTAAVIRKNGNILLCGRAKGSALENCREFPGGKQEPGETLAQCLEREIQEELATNAVAMDEIYCNEVIVGEKHFIIHFIRAFIPGDAPPPSPAENQWMAWVPIKDLNKQNMLPGDTAIASLIAHAYQKNFEKI